MKIRTFSLSKILNNEKGSILVVSYLLIITLLGLGAAFMLFAQNENKTAENQRIATTAFHIAEAGIERALYDLKQDFENNSSPSWADGNINGMAIGPDNDDFYTMPYSSTTINDGSYSVRLKNVIDSDDIWVEATGTIDGMNQSILVYAKIFNISPWGNAIFGGGGSSSGHFINGNVNISGSVHILGDNLAAGDTAIDLGGTAELVRNNYSILDSDLKDRVPPLEKTLFNGEMVETLNAELRVKKGLVGLSGSSSIGEPDNAGNSSKETVDGVYVNDGYSGNQGSNNVFSDNGYSQGYDLGDSVAFPSLSDPYPENTSQNYFEYYNDNALVLTTELNDVTPSSNFTLGNCANNCITMDGSGNMTLNGMVYIEGNNNLKISSGDITYTGTGSILVTGNALIDANLVTPTPDVDASGDPIANFPINAATGQENIIGIMSAQDIIIGTASQTDIMGLFYAEGDVSISKQTDLIGTIVCTTFDLANQVPSVFQVPETINYLPPGMIAGSSGYMIDVVLWQKM